MVMVLSPGETTRLIADNMPCTDGALTRRIQTGKGRKIVETGIASPRGEGGKRRIFGRRK
jgi:hypothetical protein